MSRYLTVTCSAAKCHAEGRVQLHGLKVRDLPKDWLVVGSRYGGSLLEFCSLACVVAWGVAMQKAHESQRAWQSKPLTVKPIDQPVPEASA